MADERKLLVVDDEEVVCQACRRIFSRQGFQVETYTDARQGIVKATENDYAIILLDIKMPHMDGIQFLERLREKKPDVPVLIITGYPSIPNAAAAMRLGACDYVTKPFTSEEVTWGVQRVLNMQHVLNDEGETVAQEREAVVTAMANIETLFWDESWVQLAVDGSALVGAALPGLHGASITGVRDAEDRRSRLPGPAAGRGQPGRQTHADHPFADLRRRGGSQLAGGPSSPVVGQRSLRGRLDRRHLRDAARGNDELQAAAPGPGECRSLLGRRANAEAHGLGLPGRKGREPGRPVRRLGRERRTRDLPGCHLAGRGRTGPGRAHQPAGPPRPRSWSLGSPGGAGEAAYRKHKLFYYAVEPFADNEIADILMGVFRTREVQPAKTEHPKGPSEPISSISITNRNLHKVQLLAAPGLLWGNEGLGLQIGQKLLAQMFPVVVTPGETQLTPANILKAGEACDRVMVLLARDSGLLPGGLARDTKPDFDVEPGDRKPARQGGDALGAAGQAGGLRLPRRPDDRRPGGPYRLGHGVVLKEVLGLTIVGWASETSPTMDHRKMVGLVSLGPPYET